MWEEKRKKRMSSLGKQMESSIMHEQKDLPIVLTNQSPGLMAK